jgi:L-iditol 2-dehydrogenase
VKAAILYAPNDMQLASADDPVLHPGDLILRVRAATICGTDIRVYRGRKTAGIRYPSVIGHEFMGEIVASGESAGLAPGTRVGVCPAIPCGHCAQCLRGRENLCPDLQAIGYEIDGAFAEYIRIPARAVELGNVHVLPDHVTDAEAALVEPLACVLNGQNKVSLQQGDTVVILGAGPIGTLHAKLARLRGAARGATLRYLPKYSPDLNPIEMPFSQLKADLRKAAERTIPRLRRRIGCFARRLTPREASNYFKHAGYG